MKASPFDEMATTAALSECESNVLRNHLQRHGIKHLTIEILGDQSHELWRTVADHGVVRPPRGPEITQYLPKVRSIAVKLYDQAVANGIDTVNVQGYDLPA
jgi:hypothetical protein